MSESEINMSDVEFNTTLSNFKKNGEKSTYVKS